MRPEWIFLVAMCLLGACGGDGQPTPGAAVAVRAATHVALTPEQSATFARTCGLCHGVVGTGAPAPFDSAAWESRNAQGMEALLDHTINGFGLMPPMGMCMECTQDDFVAFISYMSGLECEE
ncbi:MAG: c-type cytochrome [Oceanococcaceae bacterium]